MFVRRTYKSNDKFAHSCSEKRRVSCDTEHVNKHMQYSRYVANDTWGRECSLLSEFSHSGVGGKEADGFSGRISDHRAPTPREYASQLIIGALRTAAVIVINVSA